MSFTDIIGHSEQIEYLKNILKAGKASSSYLFVGPEAIGKKMVALEFAKAMNCSFTDLHLIGPSGKGNTIKIEAIRELKRSASLKPYQGLYKVFIIDNAQTLTQESQNALLKIIEEVPREVLFILISSSYHSLLPTVVSRCRVITFKAARIERISGFLKETYGVKSEEALILARFSGGRIGEALRMKDLDVIKKKNIVIDRLLAERYPDRISLKEDLAILLSWFRDIFISKVNPDKKLIFNIDRIEEISKSAEDLSFEALESIINKLIMLNSYVDANVNPKLIIDAFLSESELLREKQCTK